MPSARRRGLLAVTAALALAALALRARRRPRSTPDGAAWQPLEG